MEFHNLELVVVARPRMLDPFGIHAMCREAKCMQSAVAEFTVGIFNSDRSKCLFVLTMNMCWQHGAEMLEQKQREYWGTKGETRENKHG